MTQQSQEKAMPDIRFDCYYRYEEFTRILHSYAQEYPQPVGGTTDCCRKGTC